MKVAEVIERLRTADPESDVSVRLIDREFYKGTLKGRYMETDFTDCLVCASENSVIFEGYIPWEIDDGDPSKYSRSRHSH